MAQTLAETSMGDSNTGKSDSQPAPTKRGFFAAAGERLKRAMSGAPSAHGQEAQEVHEAQSEPASAEADAELTTSVQAKARELLLQDRENKRRRKQAPAAAEAVLDARPRRSSPPPLPAQRTDTESSITELDFVLEDDSPTAQPQPASTSKPKRPVRDSKSEALRARLGAAKAALAQAQAKRAAEPAQTAPRAADTQPEIPVAESALAAPPSAAEQSFESESGEPIRTLTIARLLARQGYYDRSLTIYDQLLAESADDPELRAEADGVRGQLASKSASS